MGEPRLMLMQRERGQLEKQGLTRTFIGKELFARYYYLLNEFAADLENSSIKEISLTSGKMLLTTKNDIVLDCSENDVGTLSQWLILPAVEKKETDVMFRILHSLESEKKELTIFDVGANVGYYSLLFCKTFPHSRIYAFEPSGATYGRLVANIHLNRMNRITPYNFGLADLPGPRDFYFCSEIQTASSLADTIQNVKKTKITCDFDTLDHFCSENKKFPDFIKCDVEGAEFLVVKGGISVIRETKPVMMFELLRKWMKCFGKHPNDIIGILAETGYRCFTCSPEKNGVLKQCETVTDETEETNFFFLHTVKHEKLLKLLQS